MDLFLLFLFSVSGMKKPVRKYMGLTILTLTEQIKRELESRGYRKVNHGVLVWQVRFVYWVIFFVYGSVHTNFMLQQVVVGSPAYL